jgi:hypothetical protein
MRSMIQESLNDIPKKSLVDVVKLFKKVSSIKKLAIVWSLSYWFHWVIESQTSK